MNKLSSILNYKVSGKQTSMIPVTITVTKPYYTDVLTAYHQFTIPRFMTVSYNDSYVLKNEITVDLSGMAEGETKEIRTVLFQGNVRESSIFTALGDEFETFVLKDRSGQSVDSPFITDNFFVVYVDESTNGSNDWHLWEESLLLFQEDDRSRSYEKRFTEDMSYEFKFGNGVNGKRLQRGNRVVIFYLESDGSDAVIDSVLAAKTPQVYSSSLYSKILASAYRNSTQEVDIDASKYLTYVQVSSIGSSSPVAYPESVESIRTHAPKAFASHNALFTLGDYRSFILSKFSSYVKDIYVFDNDYYTNNYLRYYYNIGLTSPTEDSRVNLAQV